MYPREPWPKDFARNVAEQRRQMRDAQAAPSHTHSRAGLLARFLQRMADKIDPTGDARRGMR